MIYRYRVWAVVVFILSICGNINPAIIDYMLVMKYIRNRHYTELNIYEFFHIPESKVHGANVGPICGRQDPGGPHFGPMNFAIWDYLAMSLVI